MKNIKYFKYVNTYEYNKFLKEYSYTLDDVKGFSLAEKKWYHGNLLKIYSIFLKDGEYGCFSVVYFKNFNEYRQSFLGFNGNKLLGWYENANIIYYKLADEVIRV